MRALTDAFPAHVAHLPPGLPDAPAGNFDVTDGFVLAAGSSNDRLIGSIYVTASFRYMAPVPVPQTFDPPLQFRYLLEN